MAEASLAGISPKLFLDADSDIELEILRRIAYKAIETESKYRQDLAERIIQRLAKAMSK